MLRCLLWNLKKERLCLHYNSVWLNEMGQNKRLDSYITFKSLLEPEKYLTCIKNLHHRRILSKFRCSCHLFMIERGRHLGIKRQDRLCTMCGVVEDEEHVIMVCLKYSRIRELYLPEIVKYKCTFIEIMQCENVYWGRPLGLPHYISCCIWTLIGDML